MSVANVGQSGASVALRHSSRRFGHPPPELRWREHFRLGPELQELRLGDVVALDRHDDAGPALRIGRGRALNRGPGHPLIDEMG